MKKLSIVFLDFDDIKNPLLGAGQAKATLEVGKRLVKKGHELLSFLRDIPDIKIELNPGLIISTLELELEILNSIISRISFVTSFYHKTIKRRYYHRVFYRTYIDSTFAFIH